MSLLINFKDAVNPSVLDPNATVAVFYMDGRYANESAVHARCPKAKLYGITTQGATGKGVFALDCETGNLGANSNAQLIAKAVAWVEEQVKLDITPIVVYADQDLWLNQGLLTALAKFGTRIEPWDADYDGVATVPSWASAKQYASGGVDLDIARANFFAGSTPVPKPDPPHGTAHALLSLNLATGEWRVLHLPGTAHYAKPSKQASAEVQMDVSTGKWRVKGMPWNSAPLGK